jgi:hypothetical protein
LGELYWIAQAYVTFLNLNTSIVVGIRPEQVDGMTPESVVGMARNEQSNKS